MKHLASFKRGPYSTYLKIYKNRNPYTIYFAEDKGVLLCNNVLYGITRNQYLNLLNSYGDVNISEDGTKLIFYRLNSKNPSTIDLTKALDSTFKSVYDFIIKSVENLISEERNERIHADSILLENINKIKDKLPEGLLLSESFIYLYKKKLDSEGNPSGEIEIIGEGVDLSPLLKNLYVLDVKLYTEPEKEYRYNEEKGLEEEVIITDVAVPYLKFTYSQNTANSEIRVSLASLLPKEGTGISIQNNVVSISHDVINSIGLDESGNYNAKEDAKYIKDTKSIKEAVDLLDGAVSSLRTELAKKIYATEIQMSEQDSSTVYENFQWGEL